MAFDGQMGSVKDTKDRGARFTVSTPELSNEEFGALRDMSRGNVKFLLSPLDEAPEDMLSVNKKLSIKSPSQRLRDVLFRVFEQQTVETDFEVYYVKWIEAVMDKLKARLDT